MNDREYPNLSAFAKGYLHQDVLAEYGSLKSAAEQYRSDASPSEVRSAASELKKLAALHDALLDFNKAFLALGAQYSFRDWEEVRSLEALLHHGSIH